MPTVIQFPVIPIKPADRGYEQTYICPKCGERCVARRLWVNAEIDCRCGARMEAK